MSGKWNIAIVGAGALGGHVGAYLTRAGERITFIDPWPQHVEKMRRDGLTLRGQTGPENFTVPVKAGMSNATSAVPSAATGTMPENKASGCCVGGSPMREEPTNRTGCSGRSSSSDSDVPAWRSARSSAALSYAQRR